MMKFPKFDFGEGEEAIFQYPNIGKPKRCKILSIYENSNKARVKYKNGKVSSVQLHIFEKCCFKKFKGRKRR